MSSPQRMLVGSSRLDSSSSRMSSVIPNSRIPKSATISGLCDTKPSTRPKSVPPGARPTRPVDPPRPVDQQCTHITMTRLFTDYLVCSHCRHFPGNGWLWCCTQDRELILEDEEDRGVVVKFDALDDIFESRVKDRSPTARQSPNSFFAEIDERQAMEYTQEQIKTILAQRERLLDRAQAANRGEYPSPYFRWQQLSPGGVPSIHQRPDPMIFQSKKPWLPIRGGECQTRYCHRCRPHCLDRSWVSLNGVVNGDLPREAIHGMSFITLGKRPVAPAHVVAKLGLTPNPKPKPKSEPVPPELESIAGYLRDKRAGFNFNEIQARQLTQGLGISSPQDEASTSQSQVIASPDTTPKQTKHRPEPLRMTPLSPTNGSFPYPQFPPTPTLTRRHSFSAHLPRLSLVMNTPLPDQTEDEIRRINHPSISLNETELSALRTTYRPTAIKGKGKEPESNGQAPRKMSITEAYIRANSVDITEEETQSTHLTAMEKEEWSHGEGIGAFSSEPLKVEGGLALLEESVEEHIPDIMTQF